MPAKRIFYGWWIVLAASVVHFWGAGIFNYSFTAFFNPLVEEFRWSYAATAFAVSFRGLENGVAGPLVGFLTDRFGSRRLILIGSVLGGIGFLLLSRTDSLGYFYASYIFLSIGMSFMFALPGWTAVANWFVRRRSLALGLLVTAVGVSGILIPAVSWAIGQFGWRETLVIAAIGTWIIGIPMALVIRDRPEKYGLLPDGDAHPADASVPAHDAAGPEMTLKQAFRTRAFWMISIVATFSGGALAAIAVHIMPFLISVQMSREVAGSIAGITVVASVLGRLAIGWLGDRWDKRHLMVASLVLQTVGLVIFAFTRSPAGAIAFLLTFSPGFGALVVLRLSMQGDYFGRKAFGAIQGVIQGIHVIGSITGPVFAGWVYDVYGSYQWAWLGLAVVVAAGLPLVLSVRPPKMAAATS